jgi:hypothetical protein
MILKNIWKFEKWDMNKIDSSHKLLEYFIRYPHDLTLSVTDKEYKQTVINLIIIIGKIGTNSGIVSSSTNISIEHHKQDLLEDIETLLSGALLITKYCVQNTSQTEVKQE